MNRARRKGEPLSLLLIDIDRFKEFNDTRGHAAGDEILQTVARIMKECSRRSDLVARNGGEEFVIVLPGTESDSASILAERIRKRLAAAEWTHGQMTVSIGAASLEDGMDGRSSLLTEADKALYAAKQNGRNRVVLAERRVA